MEILLKCNICGNYYKDYDTTLYRGYFYMCHDCVYRHQDRTFFMATGRHLDYKDKIGGIFG